MRFWRSGAEKKQAPFGNQGACFFCETGEHEKEEKGLDKDAGLSYNISAGSSRLERWPSGLWRWS